MPLFDVRNGPNPYELSPDALKFLQRLDAIQEVTTVHPVWLEKHPEDHHKTVDELHDEIAAAFITDPFQITSKSGRIREIAQARQKLVENAVRVPKWYNVTNPMYFKLWSNFITGQTVFFIHLFRLPLTVVLLAHLFFAWCRAVLWEDMLTTINLFILTFVVGQLYTIFFLDNIIARQWWGWEGKTKSGLYLNTTHDPIMTQIVQQTASLHKSYDTAPFGLGNGDMATIYPVVMTPDGGEITKRYIERWLRIDDGEAVLIHICFPLEAEGKRMHFDPTKPVVMLVNGLNGSSNSAYMAKAAEFYTNAGITCVLSSTRMNGGSFVQTYAYNIIRTTDVETTVRAIHVAAGNGVMDNLHELTRAHRYQTIDDAPQLVPLNTALTSPTHNPMDLRMPADERAKLTPVIAVGFSMGGVTLAHYTTTLGRFAGLSSCVSLCAIAHNTPDSLSVRTWGPVLVATALDEQIHRIEPTIHKGGLWGKGLDFAAVRTAYSWRDFEESYTRYICGLHNVEDYYMGYSFYQNGKIERLYCPLLIVHGADDPVVDVESLAAPVEDLLHNKPGVDNLAILITKRGGHIGLFQDYADGYKTLNSITLDFHNNALQVCNALGKTHNKDPAHDKPFVFPAGHITALPGKKPIHHHVKAE